MKALLPWCYSWHPCIYSQQIYSYYQCNILLPTTSLNILLLDQGGIRAKLGDFGFALEMPKHDSCRTLVTAPIIAQTNGYSPPEVQSGKFSPKSDMYSYGIVSWEGYIKIH